MEVTREIVRDGLRRARYITTEKVETVLYLALTLEKPLLLEGPAGAGKTEIGKVLAETLRTDLIRLQCYEGLDEAKALYEWNYQKQLLRIQADRQQELGWDEVTQHIFSHDYILERPLLRAITAPHRVVLLIDEIDKADEEFEAFLLEVLFRHPRPGKADLLALIDLSHSTETAAQFLLSLLAPAEKFFRRAAFLGYVDSLAEISFEGGHVVPHQPLDLNARSDFGKVLRQLTEQHDSLLARNTVLLILGDARNNRRPPRADLLRKVRDEVRAIVWLNPEPAERWNTGDSVLDAYARRADILLSADNVKSLLLALKQFAKSVTCY